MTNSADPQGGPPKTDPETLTLRARPRPVTRFNRKVLIAGAALGSAAILGATLIALNPPNFRGQPSDRELYNIDRKPMAEGLSALPRNYGEIAPKPTPQLGPALPGDMGPPMVRMERELGVAPSTRSEEHTSELQSLMRISYAVFCLKKKNNNLEHIQNINSNM